MALEIERRFLFDPASAPNADRAINLTQGYISLDPEVRIRLSDKGSYLTVKHGSGISREEYEYEIPEADAHALLRICRWMIQTKTRGFTCFAGLEWSMDTYHEENNGLYVAEVELTDPAQDVTLPPWVMLEVTDDVRYTSAYLAQFPFTSWEDQ